MQKLSYTETQDTIAMLTAFMMLRADDILLNELFAAYQIIIEYGFDYAVPMNMRVQCRQLLQLFFDLRGIPALTPMYEN